MRRSSAGRPAVSPRVSIIIPTLARPDGLERAARSLFALTGVRFDTLELVVVDNDPSRSAATATALLAKAAPFPVRYVWEARPGVAYARNAGVAESSAPLIAFLDDDQVAEPGWLSALLDTREQLGVEAVFGPVRGVAPEGLDTHVDYVCDFFTRRGPEQDPDRDQVLAQWYGCGDSLIVRDALPDALAPFCASRNRCGGEDDLLFGRMAELGARFGWSAGATVLEMIPPERARLGYTLRRAFAFGQGPASAAAAARPPRPLAVMGWMARGVAQTLACLALAGFCAATRRQEWVEALDLAVRGLGKVLWFPPFKIAFYGEAAVPSDGGKPHPGMTRYRMLSYHEAQAVEAALEPIQEPLVQDRPRRRARLAGRQTEREEAA